MRTSGAEPDRSAVTQPAMSAAVAQPPPAAASAPPGAAAAFSRPGAAITVTVTRAVPPAGTTTCAGWTRAPPELPAATEPRSVAFTDLPLALCSCTVAEALAVGRPRSARPSEIADGD